MALAAAATRISLIASTQRMHEFDEGVKRVREQILACATKTKECHFAVALEDAN